MMKTRALVPIAVSAAAAAFTAIVMLVFAPTWLGSMVRIVASYDAAVVAILAFYWGVVMRTNAAETKVRAAAQDPGRNAAFAIVLVAVAFGFVVAFEILGRGPNDRMAQHEVVIYALGLGAVVLGWLLIHTVFVFRYAHLYYGDRDRNRQSDLGLVFPGGAAPNDLDFAYFSFVLGMTFQVSDVQVTASSIRRVALLHGLISFGYNTAILALVVNMVSSLLHP
jgi:uncharacterized membrane protein